MVLPDYFQVPEVLLQGGSREPLVTLILSLLIPVAALITRIKQLCKQVSGYFRAIA